MLLAVTVAAVHLSSGAARAEEFAPAASADELMARFDGQPTSADPLAESGSTNLLDPAAASFDGWQPILGNDSECLDWDASGWRPMDRVRQFGFRHSSTHGRHVGRGLPLERSSWLNRPLHVDWFAGPLLSDQLVAGTVGQSNDVLAGLRLGWDFDYYWGLDWRFGWSSPLLDQNVTSDQIEGSYFVSDIDIVYYPWGDSKVRPYLLAGMGLAQVETLRPATGQTEDVTLLGMPFGGGIRFLQTPWLSWRLEILDNLAWGNDGVRTLNNFSFTAGMEIRLGAKSNSYWPWRSSRRSW
ncbi:MAG: hypothetical protein CMJ58_15590 [Planctomycetaceae bacterium]|nr:hypothetical protein [Planctomycetaceae bacterium]